MVTFSLQELSIEMMDTQTEKMDRAGDQSSVKILRQMWPVEPKLNVIKRMNLTENENVDRPLL